MRLWRARTKTEAIWIGLIIGGALANATDRLVDGAVTDFLDVHINGYHWPTFNLADVAIVIGVVIVIFDADCFFVDNGLLRKDEAAVVQNNFHRMGVEIETVDASDEFLTGLAGKEDPEEKRKIIGNLFIKVFFL